jgi:hypothetical protein
MRGLPRWITRFASAAAAGLLLLAGSASIAHAQSRVVAAERLVIRFAGGSFQLLERHSLRKALPPSDTLPDGPASGFWYELQSPQGEVLYRRIIGDPVRIVFEGPDPETPGGEPDRKEGIPAERVFSVLVPDPGEGDQLVLFGSEPRVGTEGQAAQELARFGLFTPIP